MEKILDASSFIPSLEIYEKEFQNILAGIIYCYKIMIKDNVSLPNNENKIRDILRKGYLNDRKIRNEIEFTGKYSFDREVPEDNDIGRVDIKITTQNTLTEPEAYYIIECKRIDNKNTTGMTGLNAEYIKCGILRFVEKKYSSHYSINGMIGFVIEQMDIDINIHKINTLLKKIFRNSNTKKSLTKIEIAKNFNQLAQEFSIHNL